jgi:capsular exopolysaccharide synthesis family protein
MELKTYITPLIKWWWLLLTASLVAFVSSFLATREQPPIYQAHTTLIIGRTVFEANPTSNDLWMGQQLAGFYADYAQREPIRNATMTALGLTWLPDYIVRPLPNSQLLEIIVTDVNPQRAQVVANELANQLIKQSPTSPQPQDEERQQFINNQLDTLQKDIKKTEEEIATKQAELPDLNSARQIADTQQEITVLQTKLTTLQTNYVTLLSNTGKGAINILTIIEQAVLPTIPIGPNKSMIILLSGAIGLMLAAGAAYLLEYLDDTLKSPEEITRLVNLPVIGQIAEMSNEKNGGVYVEKQPRSAIAEAFRSLRANLEFASVDKPVKTILVTSAGIVEGKTSVSCNLAVIMAQGGKKVVLLDADLRKPSVHRFLGLANKTGLSDVFKGNLDLQGVMNSWKEDQINIITSGSTPPNPAELIGSKKMDLILDELKKMADIIIIDGPPLLVSEAAVMATKVDGVLLVIRHGYTKKKDAVSMLEQLKMAGARILGVTLNRVPKNRTYYYGHYYYMETGFGANGNKNKKPLTISESAKVKISKKDQVK